jgi:hypothetical protein
MIRQMNLHSAGFARVAMHVRQAVAGEAYRYGVFVDTVGDVTVLRVMPHQPLPKPVREWIGTVDNRTRIEAIEQLLLDHLQTNTSAAKAA